MDIDNNQAVVQEEGLSLKDIFFIVRKHIIAICAFVVAFTVIGFGFAKVKQAKSPEYTVSASLLISVDTTSAGLSTNTAYSLSQYLTDTFVVFIEEDVVLEKVIANQSATYNDLSLKKIKTNLTSSMNGNSLFMVVKYTDSSREKAAAICNDIINTAIEVANQVDTTTSKPVHQFLYNTLSVSSYASADKFTVNSKTVKYTAIFLAAGVVLAAAYVLLRELTDNRFKNIEEVEKTLGLPVLAGIPEYENVVEGGK